MPRLTERRLVVTIQLDRLRGSLEKILCMWMTTGTDQRIEELLP